MLPDEISSRGRKMRDVILQNLKRLASA